MNVQNGEQQVETSDIHNHVTILIFYWWIKKKFPFYFQIRSNNFKQGITTCDKQLLYYQITIVNNIKNNRLVRLNGKISDIKY